MLSAASFFQQSRILCFYDMRYAILPSALSFPKASTVSIIRCSPYVIPSILTPERFPNLKTIHYLSAHPGKVDLYRRFVTPIDWVFPNNEYPFYSRMIEVGKGRLDPHLISRYISRQSYSRHRPHRMEFDLHIPGLNIMDGICYRTFLYRYLYTAKQSNTDDQNWEMYPYSLIPTSKQYTHSHELYLREKTDQAFFQCLKEEDMEINHPDATPCHNSSK